MEEPETGSGGPRGAAGGGPELIWRSLNAARPMNLSSACREFPLRTNREDPEAQREEKKKLLVSADEPAGQTIRTGPSPQLHRCSNKGSCHHQNQVPR